jgi:hypothetical protein
MFGKSTNKTLNFNVGNRDFCKDWSEGNPAAGWRRNPTKNILLEIRKYFSADYFQLSAMIACTVKKFSFFPRKVLSVLPGKRVLFINVL